MPNVRWYLVDVPLLDQSGIREQAEAAIRARHIEASGPGHELSVTFNLSGTQALVKVNGASKAWRDQVRPLWDQYVIEIFDRDNHAAAVAMLAGPEWTAEDVVS